MMNVSITGHRPERIPSMRVVYDGLIRAYEDVGAYRIIQGMAAGVDLWSARAAYASKIPFVAARPWAGHTPRKEDEAAYHQALIYAEEVVDVDPSESFPGNWIYQKRNKWMVDRADLTIAVWDGVKRGGTWNCVKYAHEKGVPVVMVDPLTGENNFASAL